MRHASLRHVRLILLAVAALFMLTTGPSPTGPANAATPPPAVTHSLALGGAGYVAVPHSAALNPTGSAFTVEAWVRRDDAGRCETVVAKGYQTAWWLGFCDGPIRFYASGSGSSQDGTTTIPAGVWTHIAVVYEGTGRKYYVNGELDYQGGPELAPTANSLPVYIGQDPGNPSYAFSGRLANVRFWNVARSQEQIRQWMHVATAEPLPGLVANWRLAGDATDATGTHDGATSGSTSWDTTDPPPSQPPSVAIDRTFNSLPWTRYGQATVTLAHSNQALLIGGARGGAIAATIDLVDAATGAVTENIGSLPAGRTHLGAAYVPTNDTAYTFGGASSTSWAVGGSDQIFAINPNTGASRTVAATLPQGANAPLAVYHPAHDKIYLFGGRSSTGPLDSISIFDPASETLSTPAGFTLPEALSHIGGAYASLDGAIYLFGGFAASAGPSGVRDTVYRVDLDAGGLGGSVTLLDTRLPNPGAIVNAVEDPVTRLLYVLGGWGQDWVHAFDPVAQTLWQTQVALPLQRYGSGVVFSPPQRHALLVGGDEFAGERAVWRIPLGDGPLVATGYWAFPTPVPSAVTAIAGEGNTVAVGTQANGIYRYRSDGARTNFSAAALGGSGAINDLAYNGAHDHIWAATNAAGGKLIGSGGILATYNSGVLGTNQVLSVAPLPGYSSATGAARFGTAGQGLHWQRFQFSPGGGAYVWDSSFAGASIRAIAHRAPADLYVLANDDLRRVELGFLGGTETNYGSRCGLLSPAALAFGRNWDWWLGSTGIVEFGGAGLCRIPAAATPGSGASVSTLLGNRAGDIAVDADNRLWFALDADPSGDAASGGLAVFEVTPTGIRNREYNWASAPLGSRTANLLGAGSWDSRVTSVGAVDERVWSGNQTGRLVTHAQRWQQLANSNDLASLAIQDVWTARGRLFAGTSTTLHVLNPDGATWDNRASGKVWDVLGDSQGRIWVATQTGIRLYTPSDWDYLSDRLGARPATATYALAEDHDGRIWIGGLHGLTLFDRDRFVATFTSTNSGLPATAVRALFVDSNNDLWAGTGAGLARFDGLGWTVYTTAQGLPHNAIVDIDQTGAGDLAISTAGGPSLYDGGSFATQSLPIPAANLPLSVDDAGRLWAGRAVQQAGEWRVYYSTNSGLRSDTVSGNAADGADRIWFAHGGSGGVSVRATYLPPLGNSIPVASNITPSNGSAGDEITINGSGFGSSRSDVTVTIGRERAEIVAVTPTAITARLTATNTSGDVTVTVGQRRTTLTDAFCAIPVITGFSPTGGNLGVTVTVSGTNFDPGATVFLGSAAGRPAYTPRYDPAGTHLALDIRPTDGTGTVRVANRCAGAAFTATAEGEFRRIDLTLERLVLNQGIASMGLVANRPTVVQHYLSHSVAPRDGDLIQINQIDLAFVEGGSPAFSATRSYSAAVPTLAGAPSAAELADVANSLNVTVSPTVGGNLLPGDNVTVSATLRNRGQTVASSSTAAHIRPDIPLRILLVPIMRNGYTDADLRNLRNTTNAGLDDLRRRLFPTGRVELYWAPTVYTINDVIITDESVVDIGDTLTLYDASHNIDSARRHWNALYSPQVMVAFGVVDPVVNNGNATGKAFWPDISQMLNAAGLSALDTLCDVGAAIVHFFTLGATDSGCDLEIPLYVGWGESTSRSSQLIGHEGGHIFGLVRSPAPNADLFDNFSHSVMDELDGGECAGASATYNVNRTLYRAPGVADPVVNPLLPTLQIRPDLEITATLNLINPTRTITSEAIHPRGKAIMSYACSDENWNTFFEPADQVQLFLEFAASGFRSSLPSRPALAPDSVAAPTPIFVPGERLLVSGTVGATSGGDIRRVVPLGDTAPLDLSYETGTWLIQRSSGGAELARTGLFPVFGSSEEAGHDQGFFAATIIASPGVATLELRRGETLLDSFTAGGGTPAISLSSPAGGSYSSGAIPVTWSASDPDGDPLAITILYSADGGATWMPVGEVTEAAATRQVAVAALPGSDNARMRVVASDGFRSAEATSPAFTVAAQPPLPYIASPLDGGEILEGQPLHLSGGATDNQDHLVAPAGLVWRSDRDGLLGTGDARAVFLSAGTHVLTLEATNSSGLSASAAITVHVTPDYDSDGLPDEVEMARGLSIFTAADAFRDGDGDGLTTLVEWLRRTEPGNPDSDGDGRDDGDEIAAGTDPVRGDPALPPDALTTFPSSLSLQGDPALDTAFPQAQIQLASRAPTTWSVSSDQPWLTTLRSSGSTPGGVTVLADASGMGPGTYHATLTFSSPLGARTVPVTLTLGPRDARLLYLPAIRR